MAFQDASKCPVKLKIFESNQTLSFAVSVTTFVHNHKSLKLRKVKFSAELVDEIFVLKNDFSMKPTALRAHLERHVQFKNSPLPSVHQIRGILSASQRERIQPTFTFVELIEWCKSEAKTPTDPDAAFVIGHIYNQNDHSFAFGVSTLRLLEHAKQFDNICADGTYKIVWQEMPLVVLGCLDRLKHFHVIALCLTSNERTIEYEFVFKTLKNAVERHMKTDFSPKILISDAAIPIRNGFYSAFTYALLNVICFIHVLRNLHGAPYKNRKTNEPKIKADVFVLQGSADLAQFEHASFLFIKKWEKSEPDFCKYFEKQWLQHDTRNWYAGYAPYVPVHITMDKKDSITQSNEISHCERGFH